MNLHQTVSSLPAGTALGRYALALAAAKGASVEAADVAEQWRDSPQVRAALVAKTAIAAGTTIDSTFAAPLAQYGIAREALTLLRGRSIIGALSSVMRRVPPF